MTSRPNNWRKMYPFGLYSKGMHDYILREFEIGRRAALMEDEEWFTGMGVWVDISYAQYCKDHPETLEEIDASHPF